MRIIRYYYSKKSLYLARLGAVTTHSHRQRSVIAIWCTIVRGTIGTGITVLLANRERITATGAECNVVLEDGPENSTYAR